MAVVERFKQELMYGLSAGTKKSGRCREVAVRRGSTVIEYSRHGLNRIIIEKRCEKNASNLRLQQYLPICSHVRAKKLPSRSPLVFKLHSFV